MYRIALICAPALVFAACSSEPGGEPVGDVGSEDAEHFADVHGADVDSDGEGVDVSEDSGAVLTAEDYADTLAERGPWNIGYQTVDLSWQPELSDELREIELIIWYPTEDEGGTPPFYLGVWPNEEAQVDAEPADLDEMPVLVVSHGTQGYPQGASFMGKYFASHGWLVVAPTHTGDTLAISNTRTTDIYWQRSFDVSTSLDWVLGDSVDNPWAGRTSGRVIGCGHSFGGYTMFTMAGAEFDLEHLDEWCEGPDAREVFCGDYDSERRAIFEQGLRDDRIEAIISLAAGDDDKFQQSGLEAISIPVLHMSADEDDRTGQDAGPYWEGLGRDGMWWVQIHNAGHLHFIDTCYSQPGVIGCEEDDSDPLDVFDTVNVYSMAFARWILEDTPIARSVLDESAFESDALDSVTSGE